MDDLTGEGFWCHAVLEIFCGEEGWPEEGMPAEWIEKSLIGYCQGRVCDLIPYIPFWKVMWWKIAGWLPWWAWEWIDKKGWL